MPIALSDSGKPELFGTGKGVRAMRRQRMHEILICSANEDLLTALHAASGAEGVRLTVCRAGGWTRCGP